MGRGRIREWLDLRTGIRAIVHRIFDEPIPRGAKVSYVFGSGLVFLFVSQAITGVLLSLYYCPSPDHAHTTVAYIVKEVAAGSFLRGFHFYASSTMVVILILHVSQVIWFGSYKGKRELLWFSGLGLLALVLAMAFTGYLLPWDQKAYFATTVGTNVASEIPLVGNDLKKLIRGGDEVGTLTLTRFFIAHVLLIPAAIALLIASHLFLFRKAGPAGAISADPLEPKGETEPFFPRQLFFDAGFAFLLIAVLVVLSVHYPLELGPPANPADTQYLPRPEWYYRPVFQWLKYWKGSWAVVGILVIPAAVAGCFIVIPFLDRGRERRPWKRLPVVGGYAGTLAALLVLGLLSYRDDRSDPTIAIQLGKQKEETEQFMKSPFEPAISGAMSRAEASQKPVVKQGRLIYEQRACNACHGESGQGTSAGVKLAGIGSKYSDEQLGLLLKKPTEQMVKAGMSPVRISESEMDALIAYLKSIK